MMKLEIALIQYDVLILQNGNHFDVVRRVSKIGIINLDYIDEISGYMALWNAVLLQALQDANGNTYLPSFDKNGKLKAMCEAKKWISEPKDDFFFVCDSAGRTPKYTSNLINKALKNNLRWRAEPGKGNKKETDNKSALRRRRRKIANSFNEDFL